MLKGLLETRERLGLKGRRVSLETMVQMGLLGRKGLKVSKVSKVKQGPRALALETCWHPTTYLTCPMLRLPGQT